MQSFPENSNYYFLLTNINETFGGLTNSMLRRAKLFHEYANVTPTIITFNHNTDYNKIREMLVREKFIPENVKIINMYEELSGEEKNAQHSKEYKNPIENEKYTIEPVQDRNCFRYFENGMYKMYVSFERSDGKIKFIDYFNESHYKFKREEFDEYGNKRKEINYAYFNDPILPRQELYFNCSGYCYINIWYKAVNGKSEIERIHYFVDQKVKVFLSIDELRKFWLEVILPKNMKNFLITDGRAVDPAVLSLINPDTYKIFMTHSTHLRPPYEVDSVIRLGNRPVLNKLTAVDGLVLLTNYQKSDIVQRYGERNNYFVIPHSLENIIPENERNNFKRKTNTGVMMARYHEEKQIDHAIKAFEKVVKEIPDAVLEIYGFGEEEHNLAKLIAELGLNNNVFLKGFTNNASVIFEEATFSVLTSRYEGFGLSILESIIHGCPPICYNIKYGPSDMIDNGYNGYLVKPDDIGGLANAIIKLLSEQSRLKELSENARKKAKEFSNEKFISNWADLFYRVIDNKAAKLNIESFDFYMDQSNWKSEDELLYTFDGKVSFLPEISEEAIKNVEVKVIIRERDRKDTIELKEPLKLDKDGFVKISISKKDFIDSGFQYTGIWDVSLIILVNNFYEEKRVGYKKSESAGDKKRILVDNENTVSIEPYYTNPYGNLSFKISKVMSNSIPNTNTLKKIGSILMNKVK